MYKKSVPLIFVLLASILSSSHIAADQKSYTWKNISGKWRIKKDNHNSYLIETKSRATIWGNSELINFNSIVKITPVKDYSSIKLSMEILNPTKIPSEQMIFFALKNFREFYAFRFVGDKKIEKVIFVNSKIKDKTKNIKMKWNYTISELASKDLELEFNKAHKVEIMVNGKETSLIINGNKALEAQAKDNLNKGRFGFSNRNAKLKIIDVKVYQGDAILFEDDFSKDSIKRFTGIAKRDKKKQKTK